MTCWPAVAFSNLETFQVQHSRCRQEPRQSGPATKYQSIGLPEVVYSEKMCCGLVEKQTGAEIILMSEDALVAASWVVH